MIDLHGKVAVVTGAGQGLGRAYAIALAAVGAEVVVNDIAEDRVSEVVATIESAGGRATAAIHDISTYAGADATIAAAAEAFGALDVLCTNAGILRDRVVWKMTDDDFDAVIATHLRGTFGCVRAAVPHMRARGGGRVILVSSISGLIGNFGQTNYSAAKAGIAAMARTWALELARFNIRVNALVPNAATEMVGTIPTLAWVAEAVRRAEQLPPSIRQGLWMGTPDDVAPLVVFLASDEAGEATGQCIALGGDKLALWSHPSEKVTAFREGGWSPEAIAEIWGSAFEPKLERYGIPFIEHPS
jgi:NAD(P)-dependent dehydrogenase (short-subunit alcohol dehydrogenase family)